jgi:acetyl-CoA synthetase
MGVAEREALGRELTELLEVERFEPPAGFREDALLSDPAVYDEAAADPPAWWLRQATELLDWAREPSEALDDSNPPFYKWFADGELNVSHNCLDRHVAAGRGERVAYHWRGEEGEERDVTYAELLAEVQRFANALRDHGIVKGDVVGIYLPMIPQVVVAMLACARIGAVHNVVFGGFSAEAVRERMEFSHAKALITVDGARRKGKTAPVKARVDEVLGDVGSIETIFVVRHTGEACEMREGRDVWFEDAIEAAAAECPAEPIGAEDPLFILYTSGSTGKPKGVLHTTGGYLTYAATTFRYVFDIQPDDVHFCAADLGWVTGHSYILYGPLATGTTTVMFESTPTYPNASRLWQVVDDLKATILYTAPTALRALIKEGDGFVKKSSRKTLRLLGSVGEPINPEVWRWYHDVVGEGRCPVVDTWWQTETGGILIAPLPGATPCKPGSATLPFFGVEPVLVDDEGRVIEGNGVSGNLCLARSWPGQARTLYGHHQRFVETYYSRFPTLYFTGDGCRRDEDGYYWITGRVDDVLNVSGHRLGTAEVESALVAHESVAEAAVVGFPHDLKGTGVCAFVTMKPDWAEASPEQMVGALKEQVRHVIGPIATPDRVVLVNGLPKTRSGKILRRMLRKIASGETDNLGDASTLADPAVLDELLTKGVPPQAKR